ncbi:MAG: SAM-dependent methyltransferase, partial [Verrucomicrobiales bacterium]
MPAASPIVDFLSALSREHGGAIPFSAFMEAALYHPELGYYTSNIEAVGGTRGADFSTSATLLPELAPAIAHWIVREADRQRRPLRLIEIGPGDGALARDVLAALPWRLRRTCRLHLVEISPVLEQRQRATLAKYQKQTT